MSQPLSVSVPHTSSKSYMTSPLLKGAIVMSLHTAFKWSYNLKRKEGFTLPIS